MHKLFPIAIRTTAPASPTSDVIKLSLLAIPSGLTPVAQGWQLTIGEYASFRSGSFAKTKSFVLR